MKYPFCEAAGILYQKGDKVIFNENKFFSNLSYADFLVYELESHYPDVRIEEVEAYLARR